MDLNLMNNVNVIVNPGVATVGKDLSALINLGNTCFMNVCIQVLEHTVPLREYFFTEKYKETFPNALDTLKGKFVCDFYNLIKGMHEEDCIVQPITFRNTLIMCVRRFQGFRQEDAHECLMFILQLLHEGLANPVPAVEITSAAAADEPGRNPIHAWSSLLKHEKSSNLLYWFYGQYESLKQCLTCNTVYPTYDPWNCLSLEVPIQNGQKSYTLADLFNAHITPEKLEGNEKYNCEKCKTSCEAMSQHLIWKCPPILVIQLKRFKEKGAKIQELIDFPFELDLKPFVSPNISNTSSISQSTVYDLYAVVYHQGNLNGGHYYMSCKVGNDGWHVFNDENRHQINLERVVTPFAYILFYKKRYVQGEPLPRDWIQW